MIQVDPYELDRSTPLSKQALDFAEEVKTRIENHFSEVAESTEGAISAYGIPYICLIDGVEVAEGESPHNVSNKDQILGRVDGWLKTIPSSHRLVWCTGATPRVDTRPDGTWRIRWRCHTMKIDSGAGLMFKEKVLEDRGSTYGDYRAGLQCIADHWSTYLKYKHGAEMRLTAADVAAMMQHLKLSRETTGKYHPDNQQDIRGYGELYTKLKEEK